MRRKALITKQIHTPRKLRDTLLPKLMSGEVRVKYEKKDGVMSRITESAIEDFVIELLISKAISTSACRTSLLMVVNRKNNLWRCNFIWPAAKGRPADKPSHTGRGKRRCHQTASTVQCARPRANNEAFHRMLTEGINVSYHKDGIERGDLVWLIDFNNPENNDFLVVNQFTVIENNINKRPDVIIFVNGLPLVAIELKNPADENATLKSAFDQIQTYKQMIPSLFIYNAFIVISDGLEAKAGTISSGFSHFMAWKSIDGKTDASHLIGQIETLVKGMLNIPTLLDIRVSSLFSIKQKPRIRKPALQP